METKIKKDKKNPSVDALVKEKNYVIIDGKRVSRTWAAILASKGTGKIIDMRAVLK